MLTQKGLLLLQAVQSSCISCALNDRQQGRRVFVLNTLYFAIAASKICLYIKEAVRANPDVCECCICKFDTAAFYSADKSVCSREIIAAVHIVPDGIIYCIPRYRDSAGGVHDTGKNRGFRSGECRINPQDRAGYIINNPIFLLADVV